MPPALVEERETKVRQVTQLGETSAQRGWRGPGTAGAETWEAALGRRSHPSGQLLRCSRLGLVLQLLPGTATGLGITPCCHSSFSYHPRLRWSRLVQNHA